MFWQGPGPEKGEKKHLNVNWKFLTARQNLNLVVKSLGRDPGGQKLVLIYDKHQKRFPGKWVDTN